jgi:hypothetical protein
MLAISAVTAWLAGILRALGAAVDPAEMVVHAEARPLAAGRAALLFPNCLLFGVYRPAVLAMSGSGDEQHHQSAEHQ